MNNDKQNIFNKARAVGQDGQPLFVQVMAAAAERGRSSREPLFISVIGYFKSRRQVAFSFGLATMVMMVAMISVSSMGLPGVLGLETTAPPAKAPTSMPKEFEGLRKYANLRPPTPKPLPITPDGGIATGLPQVYINTDSGEMIASRVDREKAKIGIVAPAGAASDGNKYESMQMTKVKVRGRGNSTWREVDKKAWSLKFSDDISFLGLPEGTDFVLMANAYDRTHVRNPIAYAMARPLSFGFVPTGIHVDLYINGEYQGLYIIGDRIRGESQGLGIDPDKGFLLEIGGRDSHYSSPVLGKDYFNSEIARNIRVRNPDPDTISKKEISEMEKHFRKTCKSIINLNGYEKNIDMLSLIDYFLHCEFMYNLDGTFTRSTFLMRNPGERLKMASVWDFDLSSGNYGSGRNRYDRWLSVHTEDMVFPRPTWINYLLEDDAFKYAVRARWEEVGDDMYESALAELEHYRDYLGPAVARNDTTAPYQPNRFVSSLTRDLNSWELQMDLLDDFLRLRKKWMDDEIATFPSKSPKGRDLLAEFR
ncbi:MAG: CotH kinase family protein [Oscillospiraceae bacterium]|nr:CotH kinase family protein [Oscillospiraceae bacterium]